MTDFHPQASYICDNPQLWHLIKVCGSSPGLCPMYFPLTNPCLSLLSWTILLACLIPKIFYLRQSFTVSVHLFCGLPTEQLPAHSPTYTLLAILSFSVLSTWSEHRKTPSSILSSLHTTPSFVHSGLYPSS